MHEEEVCGTKEHNTSMRSEPMRTALPLETRPLYHGAQSKQHGQDLVLEPPTAKAYPCCGSPLAPKRVCTSVIKTGAHAQGRLAAGVRGSNLVQAGSSDVLRA